MFGLPWWLSGKEPTCDTEVAGDAGLIPGLGRPPGGGHGNPLQYSCLENPMDRGAWWATVQGVAKSQTRLKQLSLHIQMFVVYPFNFSACLEFFQNKKIVEGTVLK